MAAANFPAALAYVWQPGYDNPADGYHVTAGDSGGGTKAGIIEATWAKALAKGIVTGTLRAATTSQLSDVLHMEFWGAACDALPAGIDVVLFNGRMQSGGYPKLFQQVLGFVGDDDVDGDIGPATVAAAQQVDPQTFLRAQYGVHYAYLTRLESWPLFKHNWARRLLGARDLGLQIRGAA
jgi:lysozyme family protein